MTTTTTSRRNILLVVAHPDRKSLTHQVAGDLQTALARRGSVQCADLHSEGFDPRWLPVDRLHYQGLDGAPADVIAEQERLDEVHELVLIFPVYWWSMPALIKGWIDRVFINGWAFDYDPQNGLRPQLQQLTIHTVPIAASDAGLYDRHGYAGALRTQIEHGLIDFCGANRGIMTFVHDSEDESEEIRAQRVQAAVAQIDDHLGAFATL